MADSSAVSAEIRRRLRVGGLSSVGAVQAARWVDDAGVLRDSQSRPGLPLRKLLRAGLITGQRQEPNGRWHIDQVAPSELRVDSPPTSADSESESADIAWYEELRAAHRPEEVAVLLVAESPPDPGTGDRRFFYSPVLAYDNLYRGVALALYEGEPWFQLEDKPAVLQRIKEDGFWLIDATDRPINKLSGRERDKVLRQSIPALIDRCLEAAPTRGVIICHGRVFEVASSTLRAAGVAFLHDEPLRFPLGNWRANFIEGFRRALVTGLQDLPSRRAIGEE